MQGLVAAHVIVRLPVLFGPSDTLSAVRLNDALGSHRNQCGRFLRSFVRFDLTRSEVRREEILPLCPFASGVSAADPVRLARFP